MDTEIKKWTIADFRNKLNYVEKDDNYAINFIDELLKGAVHLNASDIHLECLIDKINIKLRLDGMLYPLVSAALEFKDNLLTRLKFLARLAVYQHTQPQDGRLTFESNGLKLDLRTSFLPTIYGEKVVIRLPETEKISLDIHSLGMSDSIEEQLLSITMRRQGLLLLTGPSSSGKTTTIYSLLKYLYEQNGEGINIATIEDPVEYSLGFLSQTQVNLAQELSFAVGLKSILRQDPDIIMIGEMRDFETTSIAVNAALTGHLVISTIHSNQAVGVFLRLLHIELEPFLIASSVQGVLSQRLIRKLCPYCKKPIQPPPSFLSTYNLEPTKIVFQSQGCHKCNLTGYAGRTGIFEFITMTDNLQELILSRAPVSEFSRYVSENKIPTLHQNGIDKVIEDITSFEEILRVCGIIDNEVRI